MFPVVEELLSTSKGFIFPDFKKQFMWLYKLNLYLKDFLKCKKLIKLYFPRKYVKPEKLIEVPTAWKGLEMIISDILTEFNIDRKNCIEFGVEFGYSSVVFSNFFEKVIGVDTFEGDAHTAHYDNHFEETKERIKSFKNIELFQSDYRDWIKKDSQRYNLAHVDIVHHYKETYECGLWAAQHSDCTIFHATESFRDVRKAVIDIAKATGKKLYNYPHNNGLGILVNR